MNFVPKCRTFNAVLKNGHGAGDKGMALEKRTWRDAMLKVARGNTIIIIQYANTCIKQAKFDFIIA